MDGPSVAAVRELALARGSPQAWASWRPATRAGSGDAYTVFDTPWGDLTDDEWSLAELEARDPDATRRRP